jgi:hypothetical protein
MIFSYRIALHCIMFFFFEMDGNSSLCIEKRYIVSLVDLFNKGLSNIIHKKKIKSTMQHMHPTADEDHVMA